MLVACCKDLVTVDASIDIPMSGSWQLVRLGPVVSRGEGMLTGRPDDEETHRMMV
jgi:hypothetical protein